VRVWLGRRRDRGHEVGSRTPRNAGSGSAGAGQPVKPFRERLAVLAAFFAAWVTISWPWLSGAFTIPYDAKAHFQAQIQFLARSLHSGDSPFWTPNVFTGSPQIADPQSLIFSPALLLAWVTPEPTFWMVDLYVLLLLAAGGLAVAMYGFDRRWHPAAVLISSLTYAFGASAAWRIQHIGQIKSYAFFAVSFWLLARLVDRPKITTAVAAGLAAAMMIAEPDQVALLGCYVLAGFVLHGAAVSWASRSDRRHLVGASALAALVALVVAVVPLVFTVLFAELSNRPKIPISEAFHGSLHPASLLTFAVSDLFGALSPVVRYWGPSSRDWADGDLALAQNMGQLYAGSLCLVLLVMVGIVRRRALDRPARFLTCALLALLVYALGRYTPAFAVMFDLLPGVKQFRRPADATFMIGGIGAILAGYLAHVWLSDISEKRKAITPALVTAGAVIALVLLGLGVARQAGHLQDATPPVLTSLFWTCWGLLVLLAARSLRSPLLAVALCAAFIAGDLRVNNGPNESTALPAAAYDALEPRTKNETVAFLKDLLRRPVSRDRRPRLELAGLGFQWPNASLSQGFENVFGYNPLRLGDFNAATGAPDTIATPDQRRFTPIFPSYKCVFADLLGLRYIATGAPIELIDRSLRGGDLTFLGRTREAYIYENASALPRVLFADRYRVTDFGKLIGTGEWPRGFDPTREVLLENEPPRPLADRAAGDDHGGLVRLASYKNTVIEVTVVAHTDGFVVLNDVYHPWWRATVDGRRAKILKANAIFRAVQVRAGEHTVRFEFKPIEGSVAEIAGLVSPD
jgi:hypothetical protein